MVQKPPLTENIANRAARRERGRMAHKAPKEGPRGSAFRNAATLGTQEPFPSWVHTGTDMCHLIENWLSTADSCQLN